MVCRATLSRVAARVFRAQTKRAEAIDAAVIDRFHTDAVGAWRTGDSAESFTR